MQRGPLSFERVGEEIKRQKLLNTCTMETITAIKPGPKPKKEDGTPDKRRRVNPETKPKHPGLKPHKHEPGD